MVDKSSVERKQNHWLSGQDFRVIEAEEDEDEKSLLWLKTSQDRHIIHDFTMTIMLGSIKKGDLWKATHEIM